MSSHVTVVRLCEVFLFHRLTRTAYLYNGCLPWYNVVLTSRVHLSVKYNSHSCGLVRRCKEAVI